MPENALKMPWLSNAGAMRDIYTSDLQNCSFSFVGSYVLRPILFIKVITRLLSLNKTCPPACNTSDSPELKYFDQNSIFVQ